jgi:hypothetical protein
MRQRLLRWGVALLIIILASWIYFNNFPGKIDWQLTKDVWNVLQSIITVFAIALGGIWTYFNFFRGRVYHPRLEPKILGKVLCRDGVSYLATTAQLKNIGLSKVAIQQKGTAIIISTFDVPHSPVSVSGVEWKDLKAFSVFTRHKWIEPGESIEDQQLLIVKTCEQPAIRVRLRVVCDKIEWNIETIIEQPLNRERRDLEKDHLRLEKAPDRGLVEDKKVAVVQNQEPEAKK